MTDEFTKAALEVVRLKRAHDGNIYRKGKDDICMLDVAANKALDALVAAMPAPKDELLAAVVALDDIGIGMVYPNDQGDFRSPGAHLTIRMTYAQHKAYKRFSDAAQAYKQSKGEG